MSTSLISKLRKSKVVPHGFYWKFYTESAGDCILTLNPATSVDTRHLVGLLKTPTGSLFVKVSSKHSITNLTVEGLSELTGEINQVLNQVDGELVFVGYDIRLVRRKVGAYVLAIDKQPITAIRVGSTLVTSGESKLKKFYEVTPYINLPKVDIYNLVESVNGQRGMHVGTPRPDFDACAQ